MTVELEAAAATAETEVETVEVEALVRGAAPPPEQQQQKGEPAQSEGGPIGVGQSEAAQC